jgi:putative MATE family efflux protein
MSVDIEPQREQLELGGHLAGLSLPRQVRILAVWPLLEMFMAFLVGTVDLALAGRLDPEPLAIAGTDALGVAGYVGWLLGMIFSSVGIGASAMIARAIGGHHRRLANAALGQALVMAVAAGALVGLLIFTFAPWIGSMAQLDPQSLGMCIAYLRTITLAAPLTALLLVGNAALRGAGDTRTPFFVMIAVNAVNVAASLLFVYGPAPLGGHGFIGIAWGTVVAWCLGAAINIAVLISGRGGMRLRPHRLRPHVHTMRRILRVGLPNLFEGVAGMWFGNFLVLMIVGALNIKGVVGAHMIVIRFESASFLAGAALSVAASTLIGQYLGLGDPARAKQAVIIAWLYAIGIMSVVGLFFIFIPRQLISIITDAPVLLDLAETPLRICGPIQIFFATQMVLGGALRGAGDTRTTMLITTASTFLIRVPLVYVMAITLELGFNGVWYALVIELSFRAVFFAARFFQGGWTKVQV